ADSEGRVTGWVGIIYDMTQRYLMEKALHENELALKLAKEKAEAANIAKSEFMANMSHELRTPMNAVVGLSQILSQSEPLTPRQREFIDTLQLSAQSLLSLINDLLDFSKAESNSIDLESVPFHLSAIIDDIISMFSVEVRDKGISLEYIKSPEDDEYFLGDPLRIRQILTNLISNALKFTHHGGVAVRFSTTPSAEPDHVYAHISVRDTGIGIPPHKTAAVFDKFTQADMSITRRYGGSGLGLAISKNLAELMGGSITLKSVVNEGSEFVLHLPLKYALGHALHSVVLRPQEETPAQPAGKQLFILLAEDHPPNILVATTILESMGHRYEIAHSGREVLARLAAGQRYDVILMDVQMPELDGYVTTQLIRENERKTGGRRIPIIAVTAHVMGDSVDKCYQAGMDDYIAKPFDANELRKKLAAFTKENPR
ncbi:MAG: response regulator, partial [Pseudomonadota bacterium]|nr:response regulator [Pseudomonadota bacterium]